ncbi:OLC1v1016674C1 [Oldenlandia corymbosa var. corymbosa]|uniref:OLC1v1016674C1 n=1 Tax=Oldenlandia corymbosa var. corymbosa TaxID=529605 RepID=A0AAV1E7N6_OLDCO|nr:OLC1v1016674C1 [Oldenlandia corymbosa var. corymbosa]
MRDFENLEEDMSLPGLDGNNFDPFGNDKGDIVLEDFDFDLDFNLEDILPALVEQPLPDPAQFDDDCFLLNGSNPNLAQFQLDRSLGNVSRSFKKTSAKFPHNLCGDGVMTDSSLPSSEPEVCQLSGERSPEMNKIFSDRGQDVSAYLNVSSPESNGSKGSNDMKVLSCPSPESQGSGNCHSNVSEDSNKSTTETERRIE